MPISPLRLIKNSVEYCTRKDTSSVPAMYQAWDNIREEEVRELEGLFRHLYRYDHRANKLNKQRGFKKLNQVRSGWFDEWD